MGVVAVVEGCDVVEFQVEVHVHGLEGSSNGEVIFELEEKSWISMVIAG